MPNLGWPEIAVIVILALVFIGPQRLPGVARQAGKALRELKKASGDFREQVREGLGLDEEDQIGFPYAQPKASQKVPPASMPLSQQLGPLADAPWPGHVAADHSATQASGPLGDAPWPEPA